MRVMRLDACGCVSMRVDTCVYVLMRVDACACICMRVDESERVMMCMDAYGCMRMVWMRVDAHTI
jgi:hypothetical protein